MNVTEKIVYASTFASALEHIRKQSLVTGVEFEEYTHCFAATQAAEAVAKFRATFETIVYEFGEDDPIVQLHMEAADIYAVDGEEDGDGVVL